jgi:nucleotide-binding universal stress UspA family protein
MQDRPIVVGVDGTTTALRAVAWAAPVADDRRGQHGAGSCRRRPHDRSQLW